MEKNKNTAMSMIYEVLKGEAKYTAKEIAEASGFSVPSINGYKLEAKKILAEEGVEIPASTRGRKAGSTNENKGTPRITYNPPAPKIDEEALKAKYEAEKIAFEEKIRAEVKAEFEANKPITLQDITNESTEIKRAPIFLPGLPNKLAASMNHQDFTAFVLLFKYIALA